MFDYSKIVVAVTQRLRPVFIAIVCLLEIPNGYAVSKNDRLTLENLSVCGALALSQSVLNREMGNSEVASNLEKGGYAYAMLTMDFGMAVGLQKDQIVAMNKKNNSKVAKEIKADLNSFAESLERRNAACLDLIKNNPQFLAKWRTYFN